MSGEKHLGVVAEKLRTVAARIRVLRLPGLPPKGDVFDWIAAGGTLEDLEVLVAEAEDIEPESDAAEDAAPDNVVSFLNRKVGGKGKSQRPQDNSADGKPRLLVDNTSPDRTVAALRDILSAGGEFYDRGVPVRLVFDQIKQGVIAQVATPDSIVLAAHRICRPYVSKAAGAEENARLPRPLAVMYLDWRGEWKLPPFNGIAATPLLQDNGEICAIEGYDPAPCMWCEKIPDLSGLIPDQPTKDDAAKALLLIRETFKTFCFADALTTYAPYDAPYFPREEKFEIDKLKSIELLVVDTATAPGLDESAFLAGLMTAVCRPSLHLAPGLLFRAAPYSGAGTGKGLLARLISLIAYGREPCAITAGSTPEELEKRISADTNGIRE
jgi:hypothetical protein